MMEPDRSREFEAILKAYEQAGGDPSFLRSPRVASLVVSGNRVLGSNEVAGVHMEAVPLPDGVQVKLKVDPGTKLEHPVHLCFGMIPTEGTQRILSEFDIGAGAEVAFLAHCSFPNATNLKHLMEAAVHVGRNARFTYTEAHYHGPYGGIEVVPKAQVTVDEGGRYLSTFSLVHGRVGELNVDYAVDVAAGGIAEMTTKAYGWGNDQITVRETVRLNGRNARGMTKTRIAVRDQARSYVFTRAEGNAPGARGHMDCTEIVRGEAVAENVPEVVVRDDLAQVTHEAAIGMVNRKELETLMSRGLNEDEAVDVIIRGMLG
ncbi:MAG TPA: SufBD protein [Anaerolineae bacterium]|nr:SufBD protein [Anaerolineae bacterium]HIQ06059.1 SufBD protein [Anaerolineae bacterium]